MKIELDLNKLHEEEIHRIEFILDELIDVKKKFELKINKDAEKENKILKKYELVREALNLR